MTTGHTNTTNQTQTAWGARVTVECQRCHEERPIAQLRGLAIGLVCRGGC